MVTKGVGQEENIILEGTPDLFGILKNIFISFFLPVYLELVSGQAKVTQQLHDFVIFKFIT